MEPVNEPTRRPIVLNQSRLKEWRNCNRLFAWEYVEGLSPASRRSAPEIGIAVHAGLAQLHTDGNADSNLEDAVKLTKDTLAQRGGPSSSFEDMNIVQAQGIAESLLRSYKSFWGNVGDMWAPLNQEVEFLVEINPGWWDNAFGPDANVRDEHGNRIPSSWVEKHSGVFLRGRADNLSIVKGALYLVDYKTAGRMDPRDLLKYDMDIQLTGYTYGLSKQLTLDAKAADPNADAIKVEGSIIDLLVKTKVPQFARESFTRSDEEMAEFELEFVEFGHRIVDALTRLDNGESMKVVFPRNDDHCFKYGTCAFRDLCLKDTPVRRLAYDRRKPDYVDASQSALDLALVPTPNDAAPND